jgi:hypothetical protein
MSVLFLRFSLVVSCLANRPLPRPPLSILQILQIPPTRSASRSPVCVRCSRSRPTPTPALLCVAPTASRASCASSRADTPKPLQLVASAVLAAVTADGSGADEMTPDAVADTVIMLLQRADDERIVTQALKLLLNVSRSSSLAQRIAAAADGRTRRALLHSL